MKIEPIENKIYMETSYFDRIKNTFSGNDSSKILL